MTQRNIKRPEIKRVVEGPDIISYKRDRTKTMDVEHDFLIRDLIGFANEKSSDDKGLTRRWLEFIRPRDKAGAKAFNKDIREAHDLARASLIELASQTGLIESPSRRRARRKMESRIHQHLAIAREKRMFGMDDGKVGVWLAYDFPTSASYCAYVLAAIVDAKLAKKVIRCQLRECKKLAWKPIKRGRRPRYCCEEHRRIGAKRETRGTA